MKSTTARRPNPRDKLKQLKERRVSSTISQQTVQTSIKVTKNASGNSKLEKQKLPHKARIRSARDGKETRSPLQNVDFNSPTKGQIKVGSSSDASKVNKVIFVHRKTKTPIDSKKDSNRSKSLSNPHQIDIPPRSEVDRSKVDRLDKANLFQQKSHSNMDESTLYRNIEYNETEKEESSKENEEFDVFLQELTDATHFGTVRHTCSFMIKICLFVPLLTKISYIRPLNRSGNTFKTFWDLRLEFVKRMQMCLTLKKLRKY